MKVKVRFLKHYSTKNFLDSCLARKCKRELKKDKRKKSDNFEVI